MYGISKTLSGLAAVGLLLGFGAAASAQSVASMTTPDLPSRTIDVSDLDLNTSVGAEALYERIRTAAMRVCAEEHSNWWVKARTMYRNRCVDSVVEHVVVTVDSPMLTDLHLGISQALASR